MFPNAAGCPDGYFKSEDITACEKAGLTPHVPKPQRGAAVANGFFRKDEFRYDAAQDAYVCPGRHELNPIRQGRLRDMRKVDYAAPPLRAISTGKPHWLAITVSNDLAPSSFCPSDRKRRSRHCQRQFLWMLGSDPYVVRFIMENLF